MRIGELMAQLPEYPDDEALLAIESVVLNPANDSALVRCHLTHLFRLTVQLDGAAVAGTLIQGGFFPGGGGSSSSSGGQQTEHHTPTPTNGTEWLPKLPFQNKDRRLVHVDRGSDSFPML